MMPRIFEAKLIRNLVQTKRQEIVVMGEMDESEHWKTYLDKVRDPSCRMGSALLT